MPQRRGGDALGESFVDDLSRLAAQAASLLGDYRLRNDYFYRSLEDVNRFLQSMAGSLSVLPTSARREYR
jgi:hypothetical protein